MIYEFVNSSLFQTFITFAVGLVAYIIYLLQKSAQKRDAARAILLEIQSAERTIDRLKSDLRKGVLEIDVTVMQAESWSKYKYLFVRNFDTDEWDSIDNFYNKVALLDKTIVYANNAFGNDVEQIRANKQRILADCVLEILNKAKPEKKPEDLIKEFNDKIGIFDKIYMSKQGEFAYRPQKPVDDARLYLEDLPKLTTSSVGNKFKKIAGVLKK